ncbi:Unknown protein [Striga hermonthica]|uniref:Uncharacterized protein n=1 Tax=Striga hermonthica TaxID=68872 RepID=A0A9N7MPS7_STRHE|nr:Unknown protein [Striga hermonthica]
MEEIHQEMELLSFTSATGAPPPPSPPPPSDLPWFESFHRPSLDLQLSISLTPIGPPQDNNDYNNKNNIDNDNREIETLKWEAAQQIRLAAVERAYAERVMEMARREMETARSEFVRARSLWERARDEVDKAQRMKERAFRASKESMCMEITCCCCSQKFRP